MSEIPKIPDNGGGDDDRKWIMDPNAAKSTESAAAGQNGGAEAGQQTEPSTESPNPAEVDDATSEAAEAAESAEEQESKRLNKEIANNYGADIFEAALSIGMPLEHSRDSYNWSNEDKQRLLDALNNMKNQPEAGAQNAAAGAAEGGAANTGAATETGTAETGAADTGAAAETGAAETGAAEGNAAEGSANAEAGTEAGNDGNAEIKFNSWKKE